MTEASEDREQELRARMASGDAAAFALWLEGHYDFIYRVAYRLLGVRMDAEDLTHDVCMSLPQKLKSYRGTGSVRAWLGQVTLNAGRDKLRQHKRRPQVEIDPEMPNSADTAQTVYVRQVLAAMSNLAPDLRETLVLVTEGLTYAEVATAMKCPEGTVAWRVSAARDRLTKALEGNSNVA